MPANGLVRIAHRGGGSLEAENSVRGIERSLEYGVEMVEVDIRCTRDGVLALSHDAVAGEPPSAIVDMQFADLRARMPHIATLDDALEAAGQRVRLNLDLKTPDVLDGVLDTLRRHDAMDRCIVSCLDTRCLARVASIEPALVRFFSYPHDYGGASRKPWLKPVVDAVVVGMRATMLRRLKQTLRPLPATNATIYAPLVTKPLIDAAHQLGVKLYTWTVDDLQEMRRLVTLGVDGITSNRPDLLAQIGVTSAPSHGSAR